MIKPGYKTSEFWFTLVSFIFSGLFLLGLLDSNHQKENLIDETSRGLEALILIAGQLTVLFRYVKGRTEIKKMWWSTATEKERLEVIKKTNSNKKKGKTNGPTRTAKTRTRKSDTTK